MDISRIPCLTCKGTGRALGYICSELNEDGFGIIHTEECDCYECGGKGYIAEYPVFTVEEAKAILKHCGLATES